MAERLDLFSNRYNLLEGNIYISGIHALVRLPMDIRRLDAGTGLNTAAYISGYQGSPLAGYDLELGQQKKWVVSSGQRNKFTSLIPRYGFDQQTRQGVDSGNRLARRRRGQLRRRPID